MYLALVIAIIAVHALVAPLIGVLKGQSLREWWLS